MTTEHETYHERFPADANFMRRAWEAGRLLRLNIKTIGILKQANKQTGTFTNGTVNARIITGTGGFRFQLVRRGEEQPFFDIQPVVDGVSDEAVGFKATRIIECGNREQRVAEYSTFQRDNTLPYSYVCDELSRVQEIVTHGQPMSPAE